jgi:serine/threonine-protein kinase
MKASDLPLRPGDVIQGKYRVERHLGTGGMGVVVAARHVQLGSTVAIKLLFAEGCTAQAQFAERFAREARVAVRLRSERSARVLDVDSLPDGTPFIVMEYLVGKDLGAVLDERGALPEAEAVGYVLQACEAVAEAHALGIIHRDIKPDNLFLTESADGSPLVKVLDFGVAKWKEPSVAALTVTAQAMGTPAYMSPEQMRTPRDVDERTDIWSLGMTSYHLLSGALPFQTATVQELCAQVLVGTPRPLRAIRPEVSPEVAAVVMRCLEKRAEDRYASVVELAEAFESATTVSRRGRVAAVAARARSNAAAGDEAATEARERPATMRVIAWRPNETRGEVRADATASRTGRTAVWGFTGGVLLAALLTLVVWAQRAHRAEDPSTATAASPPVTMEAPAAPPTPAEPSGAGTTVPAESLPTASVPPARAPAPRRPPVARPREQAGTDAGATAVVPLTDTP